MASKNETQSSVKIRKYTNLGNKELRISKRNQEAIGILKKLRGKLG